jgi:hypothetical protein
MITSPFKIPAVMNLPFTGADNYQTTLTWNDEITLDDETRYILIHSVGANLFYVLWDTFATITWWTGAWSTGMIPAWIPTLIEFQDNAWVEKRTKLKLANANGTLTNLFIYAA